MNLGNDIQTSAVQKNFPQCWRHPASALSPRGTRAHVATEHQNVVSVTAELNLKLHLILTINFNRHTWLVANILDGTVLEANVPVSELVGGDQHSPFSFSQETLLGLESVGLGMTVPLGQMADLTEGEAKVL